MIEQSDFIDLYNALNINVDKPLRKTCPSAHKCWEKKQETFNEYCVSDPYIGKYYDENKILFVAINFRGVGEIGAFEWLIEADMNNPDSEGVVEQLLAGKKKVFKQEGYGGTLLFYIIGATAVCLLQNLGNEKFQMPANKKEAPTPEELAEVFRYLSIVQLVKCSPDKTERNNPNPQMYSECPDLLLSKEFEILKPEIVILLGNDVYYNFPGKDGFRKVIEKQYVQKYENSKNQKLFKVYHPASLQMQPVSNREVYFSELRKIQI